MPVLLHKLHSFLQKKEHIILQTLAKRYFWTLLIHICYAWFILQIQFSFALQFALILSINFALTSAKGRQVKNVQAKRIGQRIYLS